MSGMSKLNPKQQQEEPSFLQINQSANIQRPSTLQQLPLVQRQQGLGIREERVVESMMQIGGEALGKHQEKLPQLPKLQKKQTKKINTNKAITIPYYDFLPQGLLQIINRKPKTVIRVGRDYQADVQRTCQYSYKYRDLKAQKVWEGKSLNSQIMKKIKEKYGDSRNEQDACHLMNMYKCKQEQIEHLTGPHRAELRKYFLNRDRSKA